MASSVILRSVGILNKDAVCLIVLKRGVARGKYPTFGFPGSPSAYQEIESEKEGEFRTLVIPGYTKIPDDEEVRRPNTKKVVPPRYASMSPKQDWTTVWPTAKTFQWSAVPLPLRQGRVYGPADNEGLPPGKYGNAELMKIPNFLHLTPAHIKQQCRVLRAYCTRWPRGLNTEAKVNQNFPVEIVRRAYVNDGPSNKDERARLVTLKIKMSSLELDYHARDKLKRLLGGRYDPKTDLITLSADRCPLKKQNHEYLHYLLTAVYFESCKLERWEKKEIDDMEYYDWLKQPSRSNIVETVKHGLKRKNKAGRNVPKILQSAENVKAEDETKIVNHRHVRRVQTAVEKLFNKGETEQTLHRYKDAIVRLLLPSPNPPKPPKKLELLHGHMLEPSEAEFNTLSEMLLV